jgi:DNA-binding response OmpR family regulator
MDIIIVDDEPVSLTALTQLVEMLSDCRVRGFTQASAGLAWCTRNDPDLLIVGYMMPELNGIEFTQHFRRLEGKADTPVLMVTACMDRDVRNSAFQNGVNDFLNKPYHSIELQARVCNMLVLRSKQKKLPNRAAFVLEEVSKKTVVPDKVESEDTDRLLNFNLTLKRLAGEETLLHQVASVFIRTVPQLLSSISAALASNDSERAYAEAHSLKGAVAVFEAPQVLDAVVEVEKHTINGNVAAAEAALTSAQALVERLSVELASIVPQAVQLRKEA